MDRSEDAALVTLLTYVAVGCAVASARMSGRKNARLILLAVGTYATIFMASLRLRLELLELAGYPQGAAAYPQRAATRRLPSIRFAIRHP